MIMETFLSSPHKINHGTRPETNKNKGNEPTEQLCSVPLQTKDMASFYILGNGKQSLRKLCRKLQNTILKTNTQTENRHKEPPDKNV